MFRPEFEAMAACRSVSHCPYGEGYILAGSDDGTVRYGFFNINTMWGNILRSCCENIISRLHSVSGERPLITWPGTVDGQPVMKVEKNQFSAPVFPNVCKL